MAPLKPAVFLDRDGTIIREAEYLADPAGVEVLAHAATGIATLKAAGYLVVVTSNQSGVARGFFDEKAVQRVNARMQELLSGQGAAVDAIYYCPHYAQGSVPEYSRACDCRKPASGMIRQAAQDLPIDLSQSWVVGDKRADIEFGNNLRLSTVLVLTGYGKATQDQGFPVGITPTCIADNLDQAAACILSHRPHQNDEAGVRGR